MVTVVETKISTSLIPALESLGLSRGPQVTKSLRYIAYLCRLASILPVSQYFYFSFLTLAVMTLQLLKILAPVKSLTAFLFLRLPVLAMDPLTKQYTVCVSGVWALC